MEQKKLAKDIDKIFASKRHLLFLVHFGLFALVVIFGFSQIIVLADIALIAALAFIPFHTNRTNLYYDAGRLMVCRALVGKEISDDPFNEGIERMKTIGMRTFGIHSKTCGTILFKVAQGAMTLAAVLDHIPVLNKFTFVYRNIIDRAYRNTGKLLVSYQLGCYEETDEEQFYDLITYFLQDGKNFVTRTVKTEIKSYLIIAVNVILIGLCMIAFLFTKSPLIGIAILALFVLFFALGICQSQNDDFNTLCEYCDYVNTHELDTELRDKIKTTCKTGDNIFDIRGAVLNPSAGSLKKAVNSADELIGRLKR